MNGEHSAYELNRADSALTLAALEAHRRGLTPLTLFDKRPNIEGWQRISYPDSRDVVRALTSVTTDCGLGVRLGDNGLANIDPDTPAARRGAPLLLPTTPMRSGHGGGTSAWWYRVTDQVDGEGHYFKHTGPDGESVLEVRATTGHQTAVPPTVHPDTKEPYEWLGRPWGGDDGPTGVTLAELRAAGAAVALVAVLVDAWPPGEGIRHDVCLALVGALLRDCEGNAAMVQTTERVVHALAVLTGDREAAVRVRESVPSTIKNLREARPVHGWPKLRELLPASWAALDAADRAAVQLRDALGVSEWSVGDVIDDLTGPADAAVFVPALPPDIERCPLHPLKPENWCLRCLVVREQVTRYGRARAVARERLAMASPEAWEPVDLSLADDMPPRSLLWIEPHEPGGEGLHLLRPGQVSGVHGVSGSAKTHLAYIGGVQEVQHDKLFLIVDYEMRQVQARAALEELGLSPEQIKDGVVYIEDPPAIDDFYFERLMDRLQKKIDQTGRQLTLSLFDSVSQSMGKVPGWTSNDEQHVNAWYASLPKRLLREYPTHTPFTIDHPGRGDGPESIGSHAKGAGPDFRLWCKREPGRKFTRFGGGSGRSTLQVVKTRSSRTDAVHLPLDTDIAEIVVVDGHLRLRQLPPPKPGEVDVPLDQQPFREPDHVLLAELRARGPILKTAFCGEGEAGKFRRAALARLKGNGLADFVPGGRGNRGELWSAVEQS